MPKSNESEVFRFTVLRPPEAVDTSAARAVRLPSVSQIGGVWRTRQLAEQTEATFRASGAEALVEGATEEELREMLAATLLAGSNAQVANTLADALRTQEPLSSVPLDEPFRGGDPLSPVRIGEASGPLLVERLTPLSGELDDVPTRELAHFGPVGVGDLMIVEQHLTGYEMGEIAHIENVMASEFRERLHVLETDREIIVETEEEITKFMEQDLQSTERYELQSAAEEEIQKRSSLDTGLDVSASYGPTVEVQSSMDYSREKSKRTSRRRASTYAREVTERSVHRTKERIRERRVERRRTRTEDRNVHRFENTGPDASHIVGIYRYVDKLYELKLVNRGKRFFYEFIIPDPGAYLRDLRKREPESELDPPEKPRETPTSIEPDNYALKLRQYGITNISPPPTGKVVVTECFSDSDSGDGGPQRWMKEGKIQVPSGYAASKADVVVVTWKQHQTDPAVHLSIGNRQRFWGGGHEDRNIIDRISSFFGGGGDEKYAFSRDDPEDPVSIPLEGQIETLGYTCLAQHDSTFQVTIEVTCVPTEQEMMSWRHSVYDAIMEKYQKEMTEYKAALQEEQEKRERRQGRELFEAPPQRLREIERDELKRLALQLMGQRARAVDPLSEGLPLVVQDDEAPLEEGAHDVLIDTDRLETLAPEIRFGEQAFEWGNMSHVLYPYYWTEADEWDDLVTLEHADPEHAAFLRAGAARLLVPIRDNFLEAVHAFVVRGRSALDFAEEVEISDPRWLPLYKEIQEQRNAPVGEREVVRCWSERVPTNLVMLDSSSRLPSFPPPTDCPEPDSDA